MDLITAFHVIEHVPDVRAVLNSCFEVLKPGGWLIATIPLADGLQARFFRSHWAGFTEAPRHLSIPSQWAIMQSCRDAGLECYRLIPSTLSDCAGAWVLSVLPGCSATHLSRMHPIQSLFTLALAMLLGTIAVCSGFLENFIVRRPSIGIVFACKPDG